MNNSKGLIIKHLVVSESTCTAYSFSQSMKEVDGGFLSQTA